MSLPHVFISYAHEDQAAAEGVCNLLETNGIVCWMASRDIRPGPLSWAASIVGAIRESRVLVVLFSANANRSKQMARELERADRLGLPIVPLRLENVEPEGDLEYFLGNIQWLDLRQGNNRDQQLVAAIQALIPVSRDVPEEKIEKGQTGSAGKRKVYLCYRRKDATAQVERLYDRLDQAFPGRVFGYSKDLESAFHVKEAIREAIASSVLLVIIGKSWLTAANADGAPCIQSPNDFVHFEIASALEAQVPIFPILVDGARFPSVVDLPDDIQSLARRNAIEFREGDSDHAVLISALKHTLNSSTSYR